MATKSKATAAKPVRKTAAKAAPATPVRKTVVKAAPAKKAGKASERRVRVRMYRVGLGDCFLLTSYLGKEPQHMLIDCGMFGGSRLAPATSDQEVQLQVLKNITAESGGHLDVVVVTHEHMDHVSIFNTLAKSEFDKKLSFGQAWFGWVESNTKAAQNLRQKYERLQVALANGLTGLQGLAASDPDGYSDIHQGVAAVAEFMGFEASGEFASDAKKLAVKPRAAMDYVKQKAGKDNLSFGSPGDTWDFGGLKVRVLGPPTSEDQMRIMEKAGASYDRALLFGVDAETASGDGAPLYPFAAQWRLDAVMENGQARLKPDQDNATLTDILSRYNDSEQSWRRIDNQALDSVSTLALQMDKYINNTSLCLAFEFAKGDKFADGDVMIFPGDAQVGNWSSWFDIKKSEKGFDAGELLARTILYKVGHHGSHNATYKPALEKMTHPKLVGMIPTNEVFAKKSKKWTMPAPNLNAALEEHTHERLLRNDQGIGKVADPLKTGEWGGLDANVEVNPLYIDYYV
jgi:beta-lactamase superfamily II metal-dependent hydrolase